MIPDRDLTAFALGARIGLRTGHPRELPGLEFALNGQAMIHSGYIPASALTATFGLTY